MNLYNFLGSYNKAYKTKKIDKKDFEKFLHKLKSFYAQIAHIENPSEDLLKDKFKECILDNYECFVNDNRKDLSIKKNKKTQAIWEFKKPSSTGMLSQESGDINKKA